MKNQTSYLNKRAGRFVPTLLITLLVYVLTTLNSHAQTYSGPLVITKGGTYSGNWESKDSEIPAVEIRTTEPVTIQNSNIRGAGYLIKSWGYAVNVTVRHTNGYAGTPTPYRDYIKTRRFLSVNNFKNVVVENCFLNGTSGIYIGTRYEGNGSTSETVKIRYNRVKNIDGRVYGGAKEHSQFVQFNFKNAIRHAEIAWNEVVNQPNASAVEDNINMYNSRGTSDSRIKIHNNYIQGAYPVPATATKYSGGGIITDGNGDINTCPAYIEAYDNQLVGLGNYSMGIAGGNNVRYHRNRAVNSALFKDGSRLQMYTSGLWSTDYYKQNTTFSNSVDNNVVGVMAWGWPNNRNDISVAEYASFTNNTFMSGNVTLQHEADEYTRWTQKLQQNGVVLGPNGTTATTPTNQAPVVAITAPKAGASFAQGTSILLTANASDADGSIARVEYFRGSTKIGESTTSPYSYSWSNAAAGSYTLTAKATDSKGATTTSAGVNISVTSTTTSTPTTTQPTTTAGSITREYWANVSGTEISSIPLTKTPTSVKTLPTFESSTNTADNYGQRIRGYVTAPTTGYYTFWIAGDDRTELYLSTSADPAAKRKIAYANTWTSSREWTRTASQKSASIKLEAGKRYYIEALMKEAGGGDNLAVGWQLPGGSLERPIAGNRLSPMGSTASTSTTTEPISTAPLTTTGTGKLTRELWTNVHGTSVGAIPTTSTPASKSEVSLFEAPGGLGNNYGQRLRGYVTAPATGDYTFWIAADDIAELFLSTSEDPGAKRKIAYSSSWTNSREWTKSSTQKSVNIRLEAGKRYYIEALHLQGGGGDNLAVGWTLPNGTQERPIPGNRLSPMGSLSSTSAAVTEVEDAALEFAEVTAYPNPFNDVIVLNFGSADVKVKEVVISDQSGRVVFKETNNLELVSNELKINLTNANLRSGLYILQYSDSEGNSKSIKIIKQ